MYFLLTIHLIHHSHRDSALINGMFLVQEKIKSNLGGTQSFKVRGISNLISKAGQKGFLAVSCFIGRKSKDKLG